MTLMQTSTDGLYYTDADVAQLLLGISIERLRNKVTAGSLLPSRIQQHRARSWQHFPLTWHRAPR